MTLLKVVILVALTGAITLPSVLAKPVLSTDVYEDYGDYGRTLLSDDELDYSGSFDEEGSELSFIEDSVPTRILEGRHAVSGKESSAAVHEGNNQRERQTVYEHCLAKCKGVPGDCHNYEQWVNSHDQNGVHNPLAKHCGHCAENCAGVAANHRG